MDAGSKGRGVTAASAAAPGVDYTVTYEIHPLSEEPDNAITAVTLLYRADFGEVQEAEMAYNEATGLWEGTIPAAALPEAGHLLRYAARITDGDGNRWRSPSFCNPDDGYEWFGTIVKGETATDETLQTFHLFADSTALANMDKQYDAISGSLPLGARVGVFDEQSNTYYDNVRIDLRGNTSAGFNKKSHGLRFSKCQPLSCTNPLAMVTQRDGLDVSHVGFAIWDEKGRLHLMNASSLHKRVVNEEKSLQQYLKSQRLQPGIRVIRLKLK